MINTPILSHSGRSSMRFRSYLKDSHRRVRRHTWKQNTGTTCYSSTPVSKDRGPQNEMSTSAVPTLHESGSPCVTLTVQSSNCFAWLLRPNPQPFQFRNTILSEPSRIVEDTRINPVVHTPHQHHRAQQPPQTTQNKMIINYKVTAQQQSMRLHKNNTQTESGIKDSLGTTTKCR